MEFIKGVPDITINEEFTITTMQHFDEDEDRVYLRCAEYVPQFQKGLVCNMRCEFPKYNNDGEMTDHINTYISDLVLVSIRKRCNMFDFAEFEYVFYKS